MELKISVNNLGELKRFVAELDRIGMTDDTKIKAKVRMNGEVKELSAKTKEEK